MGNRWDIKHRTFKYINGTRIAEMVSSFDCATAGVNMLFNRTISCSDFGVERGGWGNARNKNVGVLADVRRITIWI